MKRVVAVIGIAMLSAACTVVGVRSGTEQPSFEVVETLSDTVEIRRYGDRLAVETSVRNGNGREARNAAFRRLFNYISGSNEATTKVAMSTPVETAAVADGVGAKIAMTAPVEMSADQDTLRMRFFLPSDFDAASAPRPISPDVRVVSVPGQTFAILRFSGSADTNDVEAKKHILADTLKRTSWRATQSAVAYFYDPPWTLPFMRRNEVAVAVEGAQR